MPLNINESPGPPRDAEGRPQPILNYPSDESASRRKIVLTVFLLIVIGAAIFLLYVFIYLNAGKNESTKVEATPGASAPAEPQPAQPSSTTPPAVAPAHQPVKGSYTIYIASYLNKEDADADVARWQEAGFQAFDVHAVGHYRVALGQYAAIGDARQTAEKWKEAFENGYWIGRIE